MATSLSDADITKLNEHVCTGLSTVSAGTLLQQALGGDTDSVGEIWVDAVPGFIQPSPSLSLIGTDKDITQTIATATVTGGTLTYYCIWTPLSVGSSVVAV